MTIYLNSSPADDAGEQQQPAAPNVEEARVPPRARRHTDARLTLIGGCCGAATSAQAAYMSTESGVLAITH